MVNLNGCNLKVGVKNALGLQLQKGLQFSVLTVKVVCRVTRYTVGTVPHRDIYGHLTK